MMDLGQTLLAAAARSPRAPAIVDGAVTLRYDELADLAARLVTRFDRIGLRPGDRLLVVMQNRLETVLVYWATQLAGVVFTPVNWRAKPAEIAHFRADSTAAAVCHCPAAVAALARCDLPVLFLGEGGTDLLADLAELPAAPDLPRVGTAGSLSVLLYTSGTTGPGKGVPRSHRAERSAALAHVAQNTYRMGGARPGEATLGVMPLYHTMGIRSLVAMTLVNGLFVCQHRFDAAASIELIARHRLSALYLVPTLYHDLLAHPTFPGADLTSVRKLGFAGAPMTEDLLRRLERAFQPEIFVNHYGSSEVYTFTVNQDAAAKPGSAGRAGLNALIRVVALDTREMTDSVEPGMPGQIVAHLASDEAFAGYWRRPDADARALCDGWYLTGDIGHFDAEGDLFVTGRIDDMIISGGENILPAEIESVLSLHPEVAEVAVAGLPDVRLGQRIVAFIRPRNTWPAAADLDAFCRVSSLADYKRPRDYVQVDEIPKSPVGKVLRRLLLPATDRTG